MKINISQAIGSLVLGTTATIFGAQSISDEKKSDLPNPSKSITNNKNEDTKIKFDETEAKKLVAKLGYNSYIARDKASSELLKMSGDINFLVYILNEKANMKDLEARRRLEYVIEKAVESVIKNAAEQVKTPKKNEALTMLIKSMEKNRSPKIWGALLPVAENLITQEAKLNGRYSIYHNYSSPDLQAMELVSKLLISTENDSKALQEVALRQAAAWTKPPFKQWVSFKALHQSKLEILSKLPESKLEDIETRLKDLKEIYPHLDQFWTPGAMLASSSKQALGKILDINITALSSNDPAKQKLALANIRAISEQFDFLAAEDKPSTSIGSKLFQSKAVSKNNPSLTELQSAINIIQSISGFSRTDTEYHKSYVSWLDKQIDELALQKLADKEEVQNVLESAFMEELSTIAGTGFYYCPVPPVATETIKPLIKSYTKLTKQSTLNNSRLSKNLQALVDFQAFFYWQLKGKTHDDLLVLFDIVADDINKLKNPNDKASLRQKIVFALPLSRFNDNDKDYVDRLSKFYYKEVDTDEFMKLTYALFDSSNAERVGKHFSPRIMLQFIENNSGYFENNIQHLIEKHKKGTMDVKTTSSKQLKEIYFCFHRLFDEGHKAKNYGYGELHHYHPETRLESISEPTHTTVGYHPDLRAQIARIETWFDRELEKSISEVISSKSK